MRIHRNSNENKHKSTGEKAQSQDAKRLYTSVVNKMGLLLMSEAKRLSKILGLLLKTNMFLKDIKTDLLNSYRTCFLFP